MKTAGALRGREMAGCAEVSDTEITPALQAALPEARVIGPRADDHEDIDRREADKIADKAWRADAVVIGAGVLDAGATMPLVVPVASSGTDGTVIVDAGAVAALGEHPKWAAPLAARMILTPIEGEMRHVDGRDDGSLRERASAAAGVSGGLGAQCVEPLTAAVWAPYLHGRAGERLSESVGRVGFRAASSSTSSPR